MKKFIWFHAIQKRRFNEIRFIKTYLFCSGKGNIYAAERKWSIYSLGYFKLVNVHENGFIQKYVRVGEQTTYKTLREMSKHEQP